jgi:hypothetical protein
MVDISKAVKIEGWMTPAELTWLAEQASTHKTIVEIGPYLGRSTRAMADNTEGTIVVIDTWRGPVGLNERDELPDFSTKFIKNLSEHVRDEKVILSVPGSEFNEALHPDLVFIDGDHCYNVVKRDILTWKSRINPGGIISGHDVSCLDVARAVGETLKDVKFVEGTQIWYSYV